MTYAPNHKEATAYMIEVMQAYVDGKEIEARTNPESEWQPCGRPAWQWTMFEYRVAPPKPDELHWPSLNERFNWVARDEDGRVFAYGEEPEIDNGGWSARCTVYANITNIIAIKVGSLPWTASKQQRPGGLPKPFTFDDGLAALGLDRPHPPRR